ncbi:hypothetical protein LRS03_20085 [Rhizobacter sp. J219]|uniref:hypothetical protein n=1 Tax=Rhizobacter sp. J219 TaxID=2898430 RepID=UPI002151EA88|nr:hypothetical protein [Rhizobacter sp. J219]MCR5885036.1 hypothetical protein [Rhizobacter sp. J219]
MGTQARGQGVGLCVRETAAEVQVLRIAPGRSRARFGHALVLQQPLQALGVRGLVGGAQAGRAFMRRRVSQLDD